MEKKEQVELPSSLEPTEKVDKLELTKKYPDSCVLRIIDCQGDSQSSGLVMIIL